MVHGPPSRYTLLTFLLVLAICGGSQGSWLQNLIDPSLSLWNPVTGSSSLAITDVGFDNAQGYVVAFGDFNSDSFVDIFVLSSRQEDGNSEAIDVYLYDNSVGRYQIESSARIEASMIQNVIASDFNADGMLDILLQTSGANASSAVYLGNRDEFADPMTFDSPADSKLHFLLMDYNMDLKPDLFGQTENGTRAFWVNNGDGTFTLQPFPTTEALNPLASPHSNSFVDINGDCLPELVLFSANPTTNSTDMEIWLLDGSSVSLDRIIPLPQGAGQLSFADLDRDGTTDFVFPVCYPNDCSETNTIEVIYNQQQRMCTSVTGNGDDCVDSEDVCGVIIPYTIANITGNNAASEVVVPTRSFGNNTFATDYDRLRLPITLRLGDYNQDGYPDMIVILSQKGSTIGKNNTAQIWNSAACTDDLCGSDATSAGRRTFQRNAGTPLENVANPFAAAFFDLGDDGTLDMIVLGPSVSNSQARVAITTVVNDVDYGRFFLKVTGLSGLCMNWCSDTQFPDPPPVGVNQPGAVLKYVWTDNDQDKRVTGATQLYQSGYLALQTPYVYFGIGDVAHYVQYIYSGFPIQNGKQHFQYFPDIMPNSQVSCNPHPAERPYFWSVEVEMMPSGATFWTMVGCTLVCILLASLAFLFGWRERKRDQIEAEEKGHLLTL